MKVALNLFLFRNLTSELNLVCAPVEALDSPVFEFTLDVVRKFIWRNWGNVTNVLCREAVGWPKLFNVVVEQAHSIFYILQQYSTLTS